MYPALLGGWWNPVHGRPAALRFARHALLAGSGSEQQQPGEAALFAGLGWGPHAARGGDTTRQRHAQRLQLQGTSLGKERQAACCLLA